MCRKCGEPDKRGSAKRRRQRRQRLLEIHGNGTVCPCIWCGCLLGNRAGYLAVAGRRLRIVPLEQDRLIPGGPYSLYNLVPACPPCNRRRTYERAVERAGFEIGEGCEFGPSAGPIDHSSSPASVDARFERQEQAA